MKFTLNDGTVSTVWNKKNILTVTSVFVLLKHLFFSYKNNCNATCLISFPVDSLRLNTIRTVSANSVESDLRCTSRVYFHVMLTSYNVALTSQKQCQYNNKFDFSKTNRYNFTMLYPPCTLWIKLIHPFKSYWMETKKVMPLMTWQELTETWSLCVCHAWQATQKGWLE